MRIVRHFVFAVVICSLGASAVASQPQSVGAPDPELTRLFGQERNAHVGESLPVGIHMTRDDGSQVDLARQLHGPVIVVKISAKCSCDTLFEAIREAHGEALGPTKARIAVIKAHDAGHDALKLPSSVRTFHTPAPLTTGFLGGRMWPTTFYFDKNLKLVKRRPGMPFSPQALLYFPPG